MDGERCDDEKSAFRRPLLVGVTAPRRHSRSSRFSRQVHRPRGSAASRRKRPSGGRRSPEASATPTTTFEPITAPRLLLLRRVCPLRGLQQRRPRQLRLLSQALPLARRRPSRRPLSRTSRANGPGAARRKRFASGSPQLREQSKAMEGRLDSLNAQLASGAGSSHVQEREVTQKALALSRRDARVSVQEEVGTASRLAPARSRFRRRQKIDRLPRLLLLLPPPPPLLPIPNQHRCPSRALSSILRVPKPINLILRQMCLRVFYYGTRRDA